MDNPYRPPDASLIQASTGSSGPSALDDDWDAFQVLQIAWERVMERPGEIIGSAAVLFGINIGFGVLNQFIAVGVPLMSRAAGQEPSGLLALLTIPLSLLSYAVQLFLMIGQFRICLGAARREPVNIGMLFSGGPWVLSMLGGFLLWMIGTMVGTILLIVPGVIFSIGTGFWMYLVLDREMGVIDAFQTSWDITENEKVKLFVMYLVSGFGSLIVIACTCCLGQVVANPVVYVGWALIYDHLVRTKLETAAPA